MNPPVLPAPKHSGLAVASCILGIVAVVFCLGPLAGIPAVICGHLAHSKIRKSGGTLRGGGLAVAGLVTGYFSFVWIFFIALLAVIAIPNFVRARQAAMQNTAVLRGCVANLKAIEGAKQMWALESKKQAADVPTEADLIGQSKYLKEMPVCPEGGTYAFNAVGESPQCTVHGGLASGLKMGKPRR